MKPQQIGVLDSVDGFTCDDLGDFSSLDEFDLNDLDDWANAMATDLHPRQQSSQVSTTWANGPRSISRIRSLEWSEQAADQDFSLIIDEPEHSGGSNLGPNPQEVMIAALNAFIVNRFIHCCRLRGISLEQVEVTSSGYLDLQQFLDTASAVRLTPDHETLNWTLMVQGDATPEQFQQVFDTILPSTRNAWSLIVMF